MRGRRKWVAGGRVGGSSRRNGDGVEGLEADEGGLEASWQKLTSFDTQYIVADSPSVI